MTSLSACVKSIASVTLVLAVGVAALVLAVGVAVLVSPAGVAAMILFIEVLLPGVALESVSSAFVGTLAVGVGSAAAAWAAAGCNMDEAVATGAEGR